MELETSAEIATLAEALAKAQAVIEGASKDGANPAFRSKYATLASVWEACRKALTDNKIAVVQAPFNGESGDIGVTTMLVHASGQWMRGTLAVKPVKFDAQGAGSVITYLRRYLLSAMVGVAPEDDDGEAAVGRPGGAPPPKTAPAKAAEKPADASANTREFAKTARDAIAGQVKSAKTDAAIDAVLKNNAANLDMLKKDYAISYDKLMEVVAARRAALVAEPGLDDEVGDLTP